VFSEEGFAVGSFESILWNKLCGWRYLNIIFQSFLDVFYK